MNEEHIRRVRRLCLLPPTYVGGKGWVAIELDQIAPTRKSPVGRVPWPALGKTH